VKWTAQDFAGMADGQLPMGKPTDEWSYGDVDAGFKNAALILDETFATPNTYHQTLETRTAMAYWQNGKVYLHCSTQSVSQTVDAVARWLHVEPKDFVIVSAYTGGGFGSKVTGAITSIIPALLSKKTSRPVMMRISREEEQAIGGARPSIHGRMKVGFAKDGRITALDMFAIADNGPYEQQFDTAATGLIVSLLYQPPAMRWRGMTVLTNTPPRRPQSQPGGMQGITLMERVEQGRAQARTRPGCDPADKCSRGQGAAGASGFKRSTRDALDELLPEAGTGAWHRSVRLGGAKGRQRQANRLEGARSRCRSERVFRRIERLRRTSGCETGRSPLCSIRDRQSRH
jgi:CO/xanthine dehydrogenase Mo-binding subunit